MYVMYGEANERHEVVKRTRLPDFFQRATAGIA